MRAKYNARLCASLRKAAGPRTMGNNKKTMRRTTEPSEISDGFEDGNGNARRREAPGADFRH
jgi:hypothetical protein